MKKQFNFKVNDSKINNDVVFARQLKLLLKRLGAKEETKNHSSCTLDLGYSNDDFLKEKKTLIIVYHFN